MIVGWGGNLREQVLRFWYAELTRLLDRHDVRCWNIGRRGDPSDPLYVSAEAQPSQSRWHTCSENFTCLSLAVLLCYDMLDKNPDEVGKPTAIFDWRTLL